MRERDLDVLMALAKMRLLRTGDLAALFFGASGTAQKRLRKLFDAGLVRTIVTDLAAENRYALTPMGHALLERAHADERIPTFRPAPRVDGRSVAHLDLLNRYRIALARSAADFDLELVRFAPEWDLRSADPEADLIPDAIISLGADSRRLEIALEVDVGTEPPRTVVRKAERYEARRIQRRPVGGVLGPLLVIVASTARRARSLARALAGTSKGVVLGAVPFVLQTGGLGGGLAIAAELAAVKEELGPGHFSRGLTPLLRGGVTGRDGGGRVARRAAAPRSGFPDGKLSFSPRYRNAKS